MKTSWRTLWQQQSIVVYRDEIEFDRLAAERIGRVFLVYCGAGDSPGDIGMSIVEFEDDADGFALFAAHTGFAGRVNAKTRPIMATVPVHRDARRRIFGRPTPVVRRRRT